LQTCEQLDCYSAGSALINLRLADSWLAIGAVHKNTYAVNRLRGLPSADIFRTVVIQMRTSALFVVKTNIEFFKIYSVSTSDMDRGGGERDWASAYIF